MSEYYLVPREAVENKLECLRKLHFSLSTTKIKPVTIVQSLEKEIAEISALIKSQSIHLDEEEYKMLLEQANA